MEGSNQRSQCVNYAGTYKTQVGSIMHKITNQNNTILIVLMDFLDQPSVGSSLKKGSCSSDKALLYWAQASPVKEEGAFSSRLGMERLKGNQRRGCARTAVR